MGNYSDADHSSQPWESQTYKAVSCSSVKLLGTQGLPSSIIYLNCERQMSTSRSQASHIQCWYALNKDS